MTIRYQCAECGSVLKIKDALAGTDGKCPKCKTKFVVPEADSPSDAEGAESAGAEETPATDGEPEAQPAKAASSRKKQKEKVSARVEETSKGNDDGDDFDPVAFLMNGDQDGEKPSAGLATPPAPERKPNVDSRGRRRIMPAAEEPTQDGSSAADSASAALNASANARDLLTKTMEDSRSRAASMPEQPRQSRFDYKGFGLMLMRGAPYVGGVVIGAVLLYMGASSMMGSRLPLPKTARVTGTVTLDGDPLPNVMVHLTPVNAQGEDRRGKPLRLRTAMGLTDENGYYDAEYMSGVRGAPLGKVRIWLEPMSAADFSRIPPQYIRPSNDIREVREAGNEGKFNLELNSN